MNKKILKSIRTAAAKIPVTYVKGTGYEIREIKDLRGKEVKNTQFFTGTNPENGILIETAPETIIIKNTVLYKVNHYRRLKKAFEANGKDGVKQYLRWVDQNNKLLNSEYEVKMITKFMTEKIKAQITEIL